MVGRSKGYAAVAPTELDPRETANAINEIGFRYILSGDGNLPPKVDFLLEQLGIIPGKFAACYVHRSDKELDFNPFDDGKTNRGILKTTSEGIYGPVAQLLGQAFSKSLRLFANTDFQRIADAVSCRIPETSRVFTSRSLAIHLDAPDFEFVGKKNLCDSHAKISQGVACCSLMIDGGHHHFQDHCRFIERTQG